jgi:hypothetical protein
MVLVARRVPALQSPWKDGRPSERPLVGAGQGGSSALPKQISAPHAGRRSNEMSPARDLSDKVGGDGGIRTLDRALQPYNGLANRRLQPLGHISSAKNPTRDICPTRLPIASAGARTSAGALAQQDLARPFVRRQAVGRRSGMSSASPRCAARRARTALSQAGSGKSESSSPYGFRPSRTDLSATIRAGEIFVIRQPQVLFF